MGLIAAPLLEAYMADWRDALPKSQPELRRAIGKRLRWLRDALNELEPGQHTQPAWEAWLRLDKGTISRWENGEFTIPSYRLYLIAFAVGASADYITLGVASPIMLPRLEAILLRDHPWDGRDGVMTYSQWISRQEAYRQSLQDSRPRSPAQVRRPGRPRKAQD